MRRLLPAAVAALAVLAPAAPASAAEAVPARSFDAALLTSHVAQFFVGDDEWSSALRALRRSLLPGGRLIFESRDPVYREWERWNPTDSHRVIVLPDGDRISIQLFPREPSFARDVARALKVAGVNPTSEVQALTALRAALRPWYPRIEIQPRSELAGLAASLTQQVVVNLCLVGTVVLKVRPVDAKLGGNLDDGLGRHGLGDLDISCHGTPFL